MSIIDEESIFLEIIRAARAVCKDIEYFDPEQTAPLLSSLISLLNAADNLSKCTIMSGDRDDNLTLNSRRKFRISADIRFYVVFDPLDSNSLVEISLGDALEDIYESLKNGLLALERRPENRLAILWAWQSEYKFHWGRHLIDVIRLLFLSEPLNH